MTLKYDITVTITTVKKFSVAADNSYLAEIVALNIINSGQWFAQRDLKETIDTKMDVRRALDWTKAHRLAALREGWFLAECSSGDWQIQKIDWPEENLLPDGSLPPKLDSDDDAVRIIARGHEPHHIAVKTFLVHANPGEYDRIMDYA